MTFIQSWPASSSGRNFVRRRVSAQRVIEGEAAFLSAESAGMAGVLENVD